MNKTYGEKIKHHKIDKIEPLVESNRRFDVKTQIFSEIGDVRGQRIGAWINVYIVNQFVYMIYFQFIYLYYQIKQLNVSIIISYIYRTYIIYYQHMQQNKFQVQIFNQSIDSSCILIVSSKNTLKSLIDQMDKLNQINTYKQQIRYKSHKLENIKLTIGHFAKSRTQPKQPIKFQIVLPRLNVKFTNTKTKLNFDYPVDYNEQISRTVNHLFGDSLYKYFYLDNEVNHEVKSTITYSQLVVRFKRTKNIEIEICQTEIVQLKINNLYKIQEYSIQCSPREIFQDVFKKKQKQYNFYEAILNNQILPFNTKIKDLYPDEKIIQIIINVNKKIVPVDQLGFSKQQQQNIIDVDKRHLYYEQPTQMIKQLPKAQLFLNEQIILSLKFSARNQQAIQDLFKDQINIFIQQRTQKEKGLLHKFFTLDVRKTLLQQIKANKRFKQIKNTENILIFKYKIIKYKQINFLNVMLVSNQFKQSYIRDQPEVQEQYQQYINTAQIAYFNQKNKNQKCINKYEINKYLNNLLKKFINDTYLINQISKDQKSILQSQQQNLLVIGRSGTGKTTTILFDMLLKKSILGKEVRNLFTTISPLLLEKVKSFYLQIIQHNVPDAKLQLIPKQSLNSIPEKALNHPLFLSIDQIILLIDGMLHVPFLLRNKQDKGIFKKLINYNVKDGKYKRILLGYVDYTGYTQKRIPDKKYYRQCVQIDYFQFENQFIPSLAQEIKLKIKNMKLSSLLIWSQIYTFISGHANSYKNPNFMLNQKQYLNRVGAKWTSLSMDQRKLIYQICSYYKQWKISKDYFDRNDIINYILQQITHKRLQNCNYPLDWVYIDEIQDFSPSFILMLSHFTARGFKLAGDTVQTIGKGKGFRLAQILYIFKHFNKQETIKQKLTIPPLLEADIGKVFLTRNYRSTEPIIAVANIILNLLTVIDIPFEKAPRQRTDKKKSKIKPVMIFNPTQLNKFVFQLVQSNLKKSQNNKQLAQGFFGAYQAVIVKQSTQQLNLEQKNCLNSKLKEDRQLYEPYVRYGVHDFFINKKVQIYTVLQSKGLQFSDVVLYNFFSSSQIPKQLWKLMNNLDIEFNNEFQQLQVKHNEKTKKQIQMIEKRYKWEFSSELKELYVAITRARNRIFFYQSQPQNIKYIIQFLKKLKIIHILELDNPKQVQQLKMSVQIQQLTYQSKEMNNPLYIKQKTDQLGRQNFENRLYNKALQYFKISGNYYYSLKCQVELLKKDHVNPLFIAQKFRRLYQDYKMESTQQERNQYAFECAIYYFLNRNYKRSGEFFLKINRFRQGAQCMLLAYNGDCIKKKSQLIYIQEYLMIAQIQKRQKPFLLEIYSLKIKIAYELADSYRYLKVLMQINKFTGKIVKNKVMFAFKWYLQSYPKEIFSRLDQIVENQLQLFCKSQKFILLLQAIKFYFQILQSQTILFNKAYNSKHIIYQTQKNQLRQTLIHSFNSNNTKLDQSLLNAQIIYMIFNLIEYFSVPGYKHYLIKFSEILRSDNLFYRLYLQEYILKPRVQKLANQKSNVIFLDHDKVIFNRISILKYRLIDDLIMLGLLENNNYWRIKSFNIFEKNDNTLLFIEKLFNLQNRQIQNKKKNTQNQIQADLTLRLQKSDTRFLQDSLEILQNQFFIKKSKAPLNSSSQIFSVLFINIINSLRLKNKLWFYKIPQKNILRYINILRKLTTFQYLLPGHLSQQRIEILYKSIFKVYGIQRFKPNQKIKICQNISQNICIFSRSSKIYQTLNEYRQKLKIDSLREFHCYTFDIYSQRFCMPFYILLFYVQYNLCQKIYEFGKNYLQYLNSQPNSQSLADLQKQRIDKSKESQKIQYIEDFQYSLMIIQKISSIPQLMSTKFEQFTSGDVSLNNIKNLLSPKQLDLRKSDQFRIYDKFYYYGLVFIHKIKNENIGSLYYISKKNLQDAIEGIFKYSQIIKDSDTVYDIQQGFKAIQCFSMFGIQFFPTSILQKKAEVIYHNFLKQGKNHLRDLRILSDFRLFNLQGYKQRKKIIEDLKIQLLQEFKKLIKCLNCLIVQKIQPKLYQNDKMELIQENIGGIFEMVFKKQQRQICIKTYSKFLKKKLQSIKGYLIKLNDKYNQQKIYLKNKKDDNIKSILFQLQQKIAREQQQQNVFQQIESKYLNLKQKVQNLIQGGKKMYLFSKQFVFIQLLTLSSSVINLKKSENSYTFLNMLQRLIVKIIDIPSSKFSKIFYQQLLNLYVCNFIKYYAETINRQVIYLHKNWINFVTFQSKSEEYTNLHNLSYITKGFVMLFQKIISFNIQYLYKKNLDQDRKNILQLRKLTNQQLFTYILIPIINFYLINKSNMLSILQLLIEVSDFTGIRFYNGFYNYEYIDQWLIKFIYNPFIVTELIDSPLEIFNLNELNSKYTKQIKKQKQFKTKLSQFLNKNEHIRIDNSNYILKAKKIDPHLKFFISQLNICQTSIISMLHHKYNHLIRDIQYLEFQYLHSYFEKKFKHASEYNLFKSRLQTIKSIQVRIKNKIIWLDFINKQNKIQILKNQKYFEEEELELINLKDDLKNFKQMTFNQINPEGITKLDQMEAQAILKSFQRSILQAY